MEEKEYSVELQKLLRDLKDSPTRTVAHYRKTGSRVQHLKEDERRIWFDALRKFSDEQRELLNKMIDKEVDN